MSFGRKIGTETSEDYVEFRDGLYDARFLKEPHTHHSYYEDGRLTRMCARCHLDLVDQLHKVDSL